MFMDESLEGKSVAIIATNYFEEAELLKPVAALEDAGATVTIFSDHDGDIQGVKGDIKPGQSVPVDKLINTFEIANFDAIVLPGGTINADNLRMNIKARQIIRDFLGSNKLVAAICHAPWLLVSAGCVDGKQLTSYESLQDDIRNAGGEWVNEEVVIDGNLITSRKPDDIPAFNAAIIEYLSDK